MLLLAWLAAVGAAREPGFEEFRAIHDSLLMQPPRLRSRWLNERGLKMPGWNTPLPPADFPDSSGLRLVGKFGRGPSVEVTGKDSLVFLSLGSEVAIINMADPDNPEVLSEPQAMGIVTQAAVRDSFLYIGCATGLAGIEVWNVQDPVDPVFRSRTPTLLSDFCINDSFLYLTQSNSGLNDTFKVYSIADPENVRLLGSCRDSGDVVTYANNTAFLGDRWGFYAIDVSDPASPRRIGSFGVEPISVEARGSICCASVAYTGQPDRLDFDILDVSNPASIRRLGRLSDAGGYDICLQDSLAFLSGYYTGGHVFRILSIADSTRPRLIGSSATPGGHLGVWADIVAQRAFVADRFKGLTLMDIGDLNSPALDTSLLGAGNAVDVWLDGRRLYIASDGFGMQVADATDPAKPTALGHADSTRSLSCYTVVARDSFAYMHFSVSLLDLRVIDVTDPRNPVSAGGYNAPNWPEDMVLRDSLLYVAEAYHLEVVNIARPREPVLVGSCNTQDGVHFGLAVKDTLAYLISGSLQLINVAQPDSPTVVSTTGVFGCGVSVRDTLVYVPYGYDTLRVYSAANPRSLRLVGIAPLQTHCWDVALAESTAAVATFNGLELFTLENPSQPQWRGAVSTPYGPRRVVYSAPYFYTAMWDAGVGIYAVESVGVSEGDRMTIEQPSRLSVRPNPAREACVLGAGGESIKQVTVRDVAGRVVMEQSLAPAIERRQLRLDLSHIRSGVYFIEVDTGGKVASIKLVKQ